MSARCPYLGLKESREEVGLVAHPHHRCHYTREPQRIGSEFQTTTCLNDAYLRCPRLATRLPAKPRVPSGPAVAVATLRPDRVRYTELKPVRRRLKAFDVLIAALILSLIAGSVSLGYVVRAGLQPGLDPAGAVAKLLATQVPPSPTATATAAPTATSDAAPAPTASATVAPSATATATAVPPSPSATQVPPSPTPAPTFPPATATPVTRPPAVSPPTRLVIETIALDIPIKPVGTKQIQQGGETRIVWGDVPHAAAFHNTSAYPGNSGNTVINGHRDIQGSVFAHLDQVRVGDKIVVYVGEVRYDYQVTEVLVVPHTYASAEQRAENQVLIGDYSEERLTLVTCTPVGVATHRLVVVAVPPKPAAPEIPSGSTAP